MKYIEMLEELQDLNKDSIVMINNGAFYIGIGRTAIVLHEKLNMKLNCAKKKVCKVGFPIIAIANYVEKLEKLGYGFVIYEFNKTKKILTERIRKKGNKIEIRTINCEDCENKKIQKEDEYISAIDKYKEQIK